MEYDPVISVSNTIIFQQISEKKIYLLLFELNEIITEKQLAPID